MVKSSISAIQETVQSLQRHKTDSVERPLKLVPCSDDNTNLKNSKIVESVVQITELLAKHPRPKVVVDSQKIQSALLASIKKCSLETIDKAKVVSSPAFVGPSVLGSLRRSYDENFHSDCIAGLLDPSVSGEISGKLFTALAIHAGIDINGHDMHPIFSRREMRLDKIDGSLLGSEIGDRRIDLLIESKTLVIIIENKVLTNESENQTADYFRAVSHGHSKNSKKQVCGLLLSPNGAVPDSNEFGILTYMQLYQMIAEAQAGTKGDAVSNCLFTFYQNELFNLFVKSRLSAVADIRNYWRGKQSG